MIDARLYQDLKSELAHAQASLVAVSKTQSSRAIMELYQLGQRVFGENRVVELIEKAIDLPKDIAWHLIGHLQTNKVKAIVPHVAMIESVDSMKLLHLLIDESKRLHKTIDVLLQVKISAESTKYGFDPLTIVDELSTIEMSQVSSVRFRGVMGMASFVEDENQIRSEFRHLKEVFELLKQRLFHSTTHFDQISMGMSGDYPIALEEGSTMVRIGSLLFGARK